MKVRSRKGILSNKYSILLAIAVSIIGLDQLTKHWVIEKFRLGETIPIVLDFFNLTYVQNKGAAFGLLSQANPSFRIPFFIIVPLVALGSIGYVFKKISENDVKLSVALSLVIAGAIGNLIDRLRFGFVVDFLDFHWRWTYHFPAFNVADSAICLGVGLIMLDLILQDTNTFEKKTESHARASHSH